MVFEPGPEVAGLEPPLADLAPRMCCPSCRGDLEWTPDLATCKACERGYERHGAYWDFAR